MSVQVALYPRGIRRVKAAGPLGVTWGSETRRVGLPVFSEQIGKLVSVTVSTRYEDGFGGHDLASFTIEPHGGYIGGMFRPGDHVRITQAGAVVADVELSEVLPQGDGAVEFHCRGYGYNLFEYPAILSEIPPSGLREIPTRQLIEHDLTPPWTRTWAWDYAIGLGMPINQVVGTQNGWNTGTEVMDKPPLLGEVITDNQRAVGERWAVWGRTLVLGPDPTTPLWTYEAPESVFGVADTEYYTRIGIWYIADGPPFWTGGALTMGDVVDHRGQWFEYIWPGPGSMAHVEPGTDTSVWEEVSVTPKVGDCDIAWSTPTDEGINLFDERIPAPIDYRGFGRMIAPTTIAQNLYEQVKGRFLLTGSFTIGPGSGFKTANGGAVEAIAFIRAGQGLRLTNLRTTQSNSMDGFYIIGRTEWSWEAEGEERMTIAPMGAVPRNLSEILRGVPLSGAA